MKADLRELVRRSGSHLDVPIRLLHSVPQARVLKLLNDVGVVRACAEAVDLPCAGGGSAYESDTDRSLIRAPGKRRMSSSRTMLRAFLASQLDMKALASLSWRLCSQGTGGRSNCMYEYLRGVCTSAQCRQLVQ